MRLNSIIVPISFLLDYLFDLVSLITVSAPAKNAAVPKASAPSAHHHASSPVGEPAPAPKPRMPPKSAAAPVAGSAGLVALATAFAAVAVRAF